LKSSYDFKKKFEADYRGLNFFHFCPKSQATWKNVLKFSRLFKILRQFTKIGENVSKMLEIFWQSRKVYSNHPTIPDISHHSKCSLT
jgi:hypothetical protein